jgi:aminopeptidase
MKDPRQEKLARILAGYSAEVKKGDVVMVDWADGTPLEFVREIQTACLERGAKYVRLSYSHSDLVANFFRHAGREQLGYFPQHELDFMKTADAYIGIGSPLNSQALSAVPAKVLSARQRLLRPILDERVNRTRWVITRYPTQSQAQDAGMSFLDFEDFYFRACNVDWAKESDRQDALKRLMSRTKQVRLLAPDTDLSFSIAGMPAVKCDGKRNMPDGEVYTAPVKNSAEGKIRFNAPTVYQGKIFAGIALEFKKGKIVKAAAEQGGEHLADILDVDGGARYVGEFSFGLNRAITRPMRSILFDEKIAGSIHLAAGAAYQVCDNGNRSAIHWDMIRLMTDGEVWLDGVLVQKGGVFLLPELKALN